MFKIQYDLESFKNDLEELEEKNKLGDWYFDIVKSSNSYHIELSLDDEDFGDAGFFEVKENKIYLEFRFFFYEDEQKNKDHDEEVYSFYHGNLVKFILSKILKNGEEINILKQ